jgi:hypothetical protein
MNSSARARRNRSVDQLPLVELLRLIHQTQSVQVLKEGCRSRRRLRLGEDIDRGDCRIHHRSVGDTEIGMDVAALFALGRQVLLTRTPSGSRQRYPCGRIVVVSVGGIDMVAFQSPQKARCVSYRQSGRDRTCQAAAHKRGRGLAG